MTKVMICGYQVANLKKYDFWFIFQSGEWVITVPYIFKNITLSQSLTNQLTNTCGMGYKRNQNLATSPFISFPAFFF